MYYKKLMLVVASALLGASFVQEASAWGTGGATTITRKSHLTGYNLFCDFDRVTFPTVGGYTIPAGDRVKIETKPSAADPTAQATFKFAGQVFCAEIPTATLNPSLADAVSLGGDPNGTVGRFELVQVEPKIKFPATTVPTASPYPEDRPGLQYVEGDPDENGVVTRTWTFVVPSPITPLPFPELLYELKPLDANAQKFCEPTAGVDHRNPDTCMALLGLQIPANAADYPERDIDGLPVGSPAPDLGLGQVFKFSTQTTTASDGSKSEVAGQLFWGVCHSQAFINPWDKDVIAFDHSTTEGDTGIPGAAGIRPSLSGLGLDTGIDWPVGTPLAITTNQNDLWNSGVIVSGDVPSAVSNCNPYCRWSNADGQNQDLFPTGVDDSGFPESTTVKIGADVDHFTGRLVGKFSSLFDIGVAKNYASAPDGGLLKLFYRDSNNFDNQEEIRVRVAEKSIQCTVGGDPTQRTDTQGNVSGGGKVAVKGFPTLNVTNKSAMANFPFTVLGCNVGEETIAFALDGSPIVTTGNVRVRLSSGNFSDVAIAGFTVGDKVSLPSCDSGTALADLNLKLNRGEFIDAVLPGTTCDQDHTDESVSYVVRLNTTNGGYVEGQDSVALSNCKKLK